VVIAVVTGMESSAAGPFAPATQGPNEGEIPQRAAQLDPLREEDDERRPRYSNE